MSTRTRTSWRLALGMFAASIVALAIAGPAFAAPATTSQEIPTPANAMTDRFGFAVAVSGDGNEALVGAPGSNPPNNMPGQAYIFTRHDNSGWSPPLQLTPSSSSPNDFFGGAVALSRDGNTALVSAAGDVFAGNNNAGVAFIFVKQGNQWTQQAEITGTAPGHTAGDNFGFSVALDNGGHEALVGAPGESNDEGAAYIFTRHDSSWPLQAKETDPGKTNSAPQPGDNFGFSVSLDNDGHEALVGADQGGLSGAQTGVGPGFAEVYTEHGSAWDSATQLTATGGATGDAFGNAVALDNDGHTALIGAEGTNGSTGAAYAFSMQGMTWSQRQKLTGGDSMPGDLFGYAVAIDDDAHIAAISS
ncbi:MAG: hypothetical protein JOY80_09725, partial [Candidatus Dormibacteraeota bacterium]|nr:hypothetical protein [Candidatus Dormibacteraeota bacterium]